MDPTFASLVAYSKGRLPEVVVDELCSIASKFGLQKLHEVRVKSFMREFGKQVSANSFGMAIPQSLDQTMRSLLSRDATSDIFLETYRRVFLTASKELGPRVMAILTAILLHEGRPANDDEEQMFAAAEQLSDKDLRAYASHFGRHVECMAQIKVSETMSTMPIVAVINRNGEYPIYAELDEVIPHMFLRFSNLGIVRKYEMPLVDGNKSYNIVTVPKSFIALVRMIDAATGPEDAPKTP